MRDRSYYILDKWNVFRNEYVEHVMLEREFYMDTEQLIIAVYF
jgi:hypothetical protein